MYNTTSRHCRLTIQEMLIGFFLHLTSDRNYTRTIDYIDTYELLCLSSPEKAFLYSYFSFGMSQLDERFISDEENER
jgi:hypothetical protein